jgi:hypothetical protein
MFAEVTVYMKNKPTVILECNSQKISLVSCDLQLLADTINVLPEVSVDVK